MLAAVISLLIASLVAVKVKASLRFAAFVVVLLVMMPFTAYCIAGLRMVLGGMTGADILRDFFSIAGQCYSEPFKLLSPPTEGEGLLNPSFAMTGTLVILGSLVSVGQFLGYLARQKTTDETPKR